MSAATHATIRPDDPRALAFAGMLEVLRGDQALRQLGVRWLPATADDPGAAGRDLPTPGDGAAVQVVPMPEPMQPFAGGDGARVMLSPVRVEFACAVASFAWADSVNLWGLIQSALMPATGRAAMRARLRASRVADVEPLAPAAAIAPDVAAVGALRLVVYVAA